MATVLEERHGTGSAPIKENPGSANSSTVIVGKPKTAFLQKSESEQYKVVFLISDEVVNEKSFDLAIDTARKFSAKLMLTYLVQNEEIPVGYQEYARAEGISCCAASYYDLLASNKLQSLVERAQAEGLNWTASLYFGNSKKATRFYSDNRRDIVIANHPSEGSIFGRTMTRIGMRKEPSRETLLIPA